MVGYYLLLLGALFAKTLLRVLHVVLLFLLDVLRFLVFSCCVESCKTSLKTLYLTNYRLQLLSAFILAAFKNLLYQSVVAVENKTLAVRHLCIEVHTTLIAADVLHTAHILILCDKHRLAGFSKRLHLYIELDMVERRKLSTEGC